MPATGLSLSLLLRSVPGQALYVVCAVPAPVVVIPPGRPDSGDEPTIFARGGALHCAHCPGTELETGLLELRLMENGRLLLPRNVPEQRCTECGGLILGSAFAVPQEFALGRGIPDDTIGVDVYDRAKIQNPPTLKETLTEGRRRRRTAS